MAPSLTLSLCQVTRARWDLNPGPPAPEAGALSMLGHGPCPLGVEPNLIMLGACI
jgi:hypothetical protein